MTNDARSNLEKDPWGIKDASGYMNNSVTSSPRSKATRCSYTQSEYQLIIAFIKQNMKLFLRLVSTDIHNKEVSLSATEFNTLRVLFKVQAPDGKSLEMRPSSGQSSKSQTSKQLSQYAPFFSQPMSAASTGSSQPSSQAGLKVHMGQIIDWIFGLIAPVEPSENLFKLNSLNKCMRMKG